MNQCQVNDIIKHSDAVLNVRYQHGDTRDIMRVIADADREADKWINPDGLDCLRGGTVGETLRNIWAFVRFNVDYKADRPGHEKIKSPGALFRVFKSGDCKSLSIAEAALLRSMGFKNIRFRFAAYEPGDFTHVYVVVRADGKDWILDAVHTRFDDEVSFHHKRDIPAHTGGIAGQTAISGTVQTFKNILIGAAVLFVGYQFFKK